MDKETKKVLLKYLIKINACNFSIERFNKINSNEELKEWLFFYSNYPIELPEFEIQNILTPNIILSYMESPFVSDFDKEIIKNKLT